MHCGKPTEGAWANMKNGLGNLAASSASWPPSSGTGSSASSTGPRSSTGSSPRPGSVSNPNRRKDQTPAFQALLIGAARTSCSASRRRCHCEICLNPREKDHAHNAAAQESAGTTAPAIRGRIGNSACVAPELLIWAAAAGQVPNLLTIKIGVPYPGDPALLTTVRVSPRLQKRAHCGRYARLVARGNGRCGASGAASPSRAERHNRIIAVCWAPAASIQEAWPDAY
jgi:hypothetical protein